MSHTYSIIKGYKAEAALTGNRIVKFGTANNQVVPGAAATDKLIGVTTALDTDINDIGDVIKMGPAEVRLGGTVTRGDRLTSDSSGKAVTAAPSAGVNNYIVAIADASGVLDDIIPCTVVPTTLQG